MTSALIDAWSKTSRPSADGNISGAKTERLTMPPSRKRAYAESPDDEAADPTDGKVYEDAWIVIFYDEERIPARSSKQRRKRRMKRAHWIILFEAMAIGGLL